MNEKRTGNIYKRILETEFEQDLYAGLVATLGNGYKLKNIYFFFPGKVDIAMFLGFECTINPQNLMKIVGDIFEKMEIFNFFFLCQLSLILRVDRKRKNEPEIFARGP